MNGITSSDPSKRQVLVNLGNRFVVFGSEAGLPQPILFDPDATPILPRVADESEVAEARIVETLQVAGMARTTEASETRDYADLELKDSTGKRILVEVKVRERDPKQRELEASIEQLKSAKSAGQNLEAWFFNIDRLKLLVISLDDSVPRFHELVPINVWEKTTDGVFERRRVLDEVATWITRIEHLYTDIREWLNSEDALHFDETRTVTMSEEMMQLFAVSDRELKILDILHGDKVVASFVPRGLWLVGAWGRIDLITEERTSILVLLKGDNNFQWHVAPARDEPRRMKLFDKQALLELVRGR